MDEMQLHNLRRKASQYKEVLKNTLTYRQAWTDQLSQKILDQLNYIMGTIELSGEVNVRSDLENLEAVVLSLGTIRSGMFQRVNDNVKRDLIKHNGSLVYQQLFNGKVMVLIQYPYIENYGEPRPPKTVGIYRPEELQEPFFFRHMEEFLQEITLWEDYDDDEPHQRIGFQLNFGTPQEVDEE